MLQMLLLLLLLPSLALWLDLGSSSLLLASMLRAHLPLLIS